LYAFVTKSGLQIQAMKSMLVWSLKIFQIIAIIQFVLATLAEHLRCLSTQKAFKSRVSLVEVSGSRKKDLADEDACVRLRFPANTTLE